MKLSIITINKDNAEGLQKTLDSVACQTWHDFEHIIVDGASADSSVDIIRNYAADVHPYLVKWLSEPDTGIYNAMNKGIRMANGEYCLFLNSGDYLAKANVLHLVFGYIITADLIAGYVIEEKSGRMIKPVKELSPRFLYKQGLPHQALFIKRELFHFIGEYDERFMVLGDHDFNMRAAISSVSYRQLDVLIAYVEPNGLSNTAFEVMKQESEYLENKNFCKGILTDYSYFLNHKELGHPAIEWIVRSNIPFKILKFIYKLFVHKYPQ